MDSLTHSHSKNAYFYIHYSYSIKVTALSIFQNFWVDTSLKLRVIFDLKLDEIMTFYMKSIDMTDIITKYDRHTIFKGRRMCHFVMVSLWYESLSTNTEFRGFYFKMNNC